MTCLHALPGIVQIESWLHVPQVLSTAVLKAAAITACYC